MNFDSYCYTLPDVRTMAGIQNTGNTYMENILFGCHLIPDIVTATQSKHPSYKQTGEKQFHII